MKLFSIFLFVVLALPSLFAFQAHDQNLAYTHPAIVVSSSVSYISVQNVPAGTTITSTNYWTPLLGTAPSTEPGTPPTTEPSTSDSNLSNLTPPEDSIELDNTARLVNISTRGYVGTAANQELVGGFVLKGTPGGTKTILVKGVAQYMVGADGLTNSDLLDNPKLQLQDAFGKIVAVNNDWQTTLDLSSVADVNKSIFATSYSSSKLQESNYDAYRNELNNQTSAAAMLITVPLLTSQQAADLFGNAAYAGYNLFTAVVSSESGNVGVAQVAIEDLNRSGNYSSTAKLVNISTRGYIGSDSKHKLVGGFVLLGESGKAKKLLAKGSAQYMVGADGLTTSDLLQDPQLKLQDIVANVVSRNDNWGVSANLDSSDTSSVFNTTYDVNGLSGSDYDLYRNELNNRSNASAMLINLPMMTSDQAQSLAGNSAYAANMMVEQDIEKDELTRLREARMAQLRRE